MTQLHYQVALDPVIWNGRRKIPDTRTARSVVDLNLDEIELRQYRLLFWLAESIFTAEKKESEPLHQNHAAINESEAEDTWTGKKQKSRPYIFFIYGFDRSHFEFLHVLMTISFYWSAIKYNYFIVRAVFPNVNLNEMLQTLPISLAFDVFAH